MEESRWQALQSEVESQFRLVPNRSAHAPDHWERVKRYGLYLARHSRGDLKVVRLFALLHDSRRQEETYDPQHGPRAAEYAQRLCGTAFELEPERLELLMTACRDHERGFTSQDPTIGSCWDADRLDLDRVGITTKASYMSTEHGVLLAQMLPYRRRQLVGITDPY